MDEHSKHVRRRLMDIDEVAALTGLAKDTLYKMVSQRRIPFVKIGRLVKFDSLRLEAWIDEQSVMPMLPKGSR